MKAVNHIIGLAVVVMIAQVTFAQVTIGDNTKLNAGALFTFGYSDAYGDQISSNHGLDFGLDGRLSGYYYNPNFISFTATPYINQSRANSSYQSLTGASGVNGTANFFSGSKFPGSVSYHYDANSTGTFGLVGQPNFTTVGRSQGFSVNWSALLPNMPTVTVGYSQGGGHSTLYGTNDEANSSTKLFNVHSNYDIAGFRLNAYYDHNSLDSTFPEFLVSPQESVQNSSGNDIGFGAQHALPLHGSVYATFNRSSASSDFVANQLQGSGSTVVANSTSSYTDNNETVSASFHPTEKLTLNATQNYIDNLTGYLTQNLTGTGGVVPALNLGSGSHSSTAGGGANYQFTHFLSASAQGIYYDQYYFGKSYTGSYVSGTVNYGKRLLDMFTFTGSVIDSDNGQGTNALGFIGTVNFFRRFGGWQTSGSFSYAQNVQTLLVTYTTSYYNYSANLHRKLPAGLTWTAAFNGSHSGLTNYQGTSSSGQSYSTSLNSQRFSVNGIFVKSDGVSLLGTGGLVGTPPTPGVNDFIFFGGESYGGGVSVTPVRRLVISGSFNRAISNTIGSTTSHNNTEIANAQLQYHLRKIGFQAGYTRFSQGISAVGTPANTTSFFVGVTRWFDFF
jgi:hypothetical protein